jgi:hypothetical protein
VLLFRGWAKSASLGASIAIAALLAAGGCASISNYSVSPVKPELLPEYTLQLEVRGEPVYDNDSYEVNLGFELRAHAEFAYNAVVQEIVQEVEYRRYDGRIIRERLTLVEAFMLTRIGTDNDGRVVYRLPSFQRDRHYERGYRSVGPMVESVDVWRVVRYYPGYVEGADWTRLGFAHLPSNREGSIVTDIPPNFNESHQRNHELRGSVVQDDRANGGFYHMRYRWQRAGQERQPTATFTFNPDGRPDDEPAWLTYTIDHGTRQAIAGESR